jgi:hypothetical protein
MFDQFFLKGSHWELMEITHFGDKYVHIKTDAGGQTKSGPKGFSIKSPAKVFFYQSPSFLVFSVSLGLLSNKNSFWYEYIATLKG